jgi:signal transduction histidine kinase
MSGFEIRLNTAHDRATFAAPSSPAPTELLRQRETLLGFVESISSELELRPLLTQIVRCACELIGADRGTIGLYDAKRNVFRTEAVYRMPPGELGAEMPPGVGLAGQVMLAQGPVILDRYGDVDKPMSSDGLLEDTVIGVPIVQRDEMIGFFGIGSASPPEGGPRRRFRQEDVDALAVFARHAAIAIDNARRYTHEQRRTERFELVARIAQTITADLRLRDVLQTAADAIHQFLGYSNVAIGLLEPDDPDMLVFRAVSGPQRAMMEAGSNEPLRIPIRRGVVGAAVREKRVILVKNVAADSRYIAPPGMEGITSELALPIRLKDEVLGVLNIESEEAFTPEEAAALEIVADQLAVAIENARLYERGQRLAILEERQRLARELHDSVTQQLFGLTMVAQSLAPAWRRDPEEGARRGQRLLDLSRTALAEMRALLAELRPAESIETEIEVIEPLWGIGRVRRDGLPQALRNYTNGPQFEELEVRVETRGYRRQPEVVENALYWIAREALHNVVKHASARVVDVRLASDNGMTRLIVGDDGVGFDADAPLDPRPDGSGLGLASMRDRVQSLGGHVSIRSAPGSGTRVSVAVPLIES